MNIVIFVVGIAGALILQGFNFLLRSIESLSFIPTAPVDSYASVAELIGKPHTPWFRYLAFRLLPVVILLSLIVGTTQEFAFNLPEDVWLSIFGFLLFTSAFVIFQAMRLMPFWRLQIVHWSIFIGTALLSVFFGLLAQVFDFSALAISLPDLVNNLVASVLGAVLVLLYLRFTNMSDQRSGSSSRETDIKNLLTARFINIWEKFGPTIESVCAEYKLDRLLIASIIVYEDLNRPKMIRVLENLIVRIPRVELTVGITQVKSCRPLTDTESITELAKFLNEKLKSQSMLGSSFAVPEALIAFNGSKKYATEVQKIYLSLSSSYGHICLIDRG